MYNSQNLTQAIGQLEQEMKRQSDQLVAKTAELKNLDEEKKKAEEQIIQLKHRLTEIDQTHRRVADELTKARLGHETNRKKIEDVQRASQATMKEIGKK